MQPFSTFAHSPSAGIARITSVKCGECMFYYTNTQGYFKNNLHSKCVENNIKWQGRCIKSPLYYVVLCLGVFFFEIFLTNSHILNFFFSVGDEKSATEAFLIVHKNIKYFSLSSIIYQWDMPFLISYSWLKQYHTNIAL